MNAKTAKEKKTGTRSVQDVLKDIKKDIMENDNSLREWAREAVFKDIDKTIKLVNPSAQVNKEQESVLRETMDTASWWSDQKTNWKELVTMLNSFSG